MAAADKKEKDPVILMAEVVDFPRKETPATRDFQEIGFSPTFPAPVADKVLANFTKAAKIVNSRQEAETKAARNLALKLIGDKKRALNLVSRINKEGLPLVSAVNCLLAVASVIEPGQPVTAERLTELLGGLPDDMSKKVWADTFMPLVDFAGLTIKDGATTRRFATAQELQCKCYKAISCLEQIGGFVLSTSDRFAGKVIRTDPYSVQTKNGDVVRHEKPHETLEGKELARKLADSEYKAKMAEAIRKNQRIADGDGEYGNSGGMNFLGDFSKNKPMLAVAGLALILVVAAVAEMGSKQPREMNPALASLPTFNAAAIAAQAGE